MRAAEVENLEKDFTAKIEELDFQNSENKDALDKLAIGKVYSEIEYRTMSMKFGHLFKAGTGAEAIREIISELDLDELITQLKEDAKNSSGQKHKKS